MADEIINGLIERQVEQRVKTLVQTTVAYEIGVAAERERCAQIVEACQTGARSGILRGSCDVYALLDAALAAIRKGEP